MDGKLVAFSASGKDFLRPNGKGLFFKFHMKAFFKDVFRRMAVLFVSAFLFAILSLIIFSFFAGSLFSPKLERIKKDSFLVLDLTMNLTDRPADVSFEDLTRQALADEEMIPAYHLWKRWLPLRLLQKKKT